MKARKPREMVKLCRLCDGTGGALFQPCLPCRGTGKAKLRCPQCWRWRHVRHFFGKKNGELVKNCGDCRRKYAGWETKSLAERIAATNPRKHIPSDGPLLVKFKHRSGNGKTGPIPVSMTSASSCPRSCEFYANGCYAEQHLLGMHWERLSNGAGISWDEFCAEVEKIPRGQLWRHNEAGDLPGIDEELDVMKLDQLVTAQAGARGFTYTAKRQRFDAMLDAVRRGFTINLSAPSLQAADQLWKHGLPVTVVLPHDAPLKGNKTPILGIPIVVCPAQLREEVTCERCKLCAVPERKSIVGFLAHGGRKKQITERHRQLPLYKEHKHGKRRNTTAESAEGLG